MVLVAYGHGLRAAELVDLRLVAVSHIVGHSREYLTNLTWTKAG
jgi:hypothetical protein